MERPGFGALFITPLTQTKPTTLDRPVVSQFIEAQSATWAKAWSAMAAITTSASPTGGRRVKRAAG